MQIKWGNTCRSSDGNSCKSYDATLTNQDENMQVIFYDHLVNLMSYWSDLGLCIDSIQDQIVHWCSSNKKIEMWFEESQKWIFTRLITRLHIYLSASIDTSDILIQQIYGSTLTHFCIQVLCVFSCPQHTDTNQFDIPDFWSLCQISLKVSITERPLHVVISFAFRPLFCAGSFLAFFTTFSKCFYEKFF